MYNSNDLTDFNDFDMYYRGRGSNLQKVLNVALLINELLINKMNQTYIE